MALGFERAWQLANDVEFVPADACPPSVREVLEQKPGSMVIRRKHSRTPGLVLDAESCSFLERFRTPSLVADVLLQFEGESETSATVFAELVLPLLNRCRKERILVDAGGQAPERDHLVAGHAIDRYRVERPLQVTDDTGVYKVIAEDGSPGALKIAFAREELLANERAILSRLNGTVCPSVISEGMYRGAPYLVTEWCEGVSLALAAATFRREPNGFGRILDMVVSLLTTYSELHDEGVLHGDVHLGNAIMAAGGRIRLIDFGLACSGDEHRVPRAGVIEFYEPELARSQLEHLPAPRPTFSGEQYGLAALSFRLLTGASYIEFPSTKREALQAILAAEPRSFASVGHHSHPAVEEVLGCALEKLPEHRFDSVREFAAAISRVRGPRASDPPTRVGVSLLRGLSATVEEAPSPWGSEWAQARRGGPALSVKIGALGVALGLCRGAALTDSPTLLCKAQEWLNWARMNAKSSDGWVAPELDLDRDLVGEVSLLHSPVGHSFVNAVVAYTSGHGLQASDAATEFVAIARGGVGDPSSAHRWDATLGACSILAGCTALRELIRVDWWSRWALPIPPIAELSDELVEQILRSMQASDGTPVIGFAHGVGGIVHTLLRKHEIACEAVPASVVAMAEEFMGRGEPTPTGLRWGVSTAGSPRYVHSWCNGGAGAILTLTTIGRVLRHARAIRYAELTGEEIWLRQGEIQNHSLCCGSAGIAYSFAALAHATGEKLWFRRAEALIGGEINGRSLDQFPMSLFKGRFGLGLAALDLASPATMRFPIYEGLT